MVLDFLYFELHPVSIVKTVDLIEQAEEPLEDILPIDDVAELQEYFGDYTPLFES